MGQGREDLDFHGIGSRRQGVRNVEAFSTFRNKGAGQREMGTTGWWQGREKREGQLRTEALSTGVPLMEGGESLSFSQK